MKIINILHLLLICFSLHSCIGEDIIEDTIDTDLRINNPLESIIIGGEFQLETTFLNNVGEEATTTLLWESSDNEILTVDEDGNLLGISEGIAVIKVSSTNSDGSVTFSEDEISVVDSLPTGGFYLLENTSSNLGGTITTTSSYALSGTFIIEHVVDEGIIRISINDDYTASTALPGLYLYLTNNPNSVNDAYEVAAVSVFNGAHIYEIPDTEVSINEFAYLLYWCKPFSVKVGEATIE